MPKASTKCTTSVVSLHLKRYGHKPADLSPSLLSYWHGRINTALFNRELGRVTLTCGPTGDDMPMAVDGYYSADPYSPVIHVDSRCKTKRHVLDTLTHEMVHQLQHQRGLPLTHGRFFNAQAKRLAKHGLTL